MTSIKNLTVDWDKSGIAPLKPRRASGVVAALLGAEADLADARERVSISATDTYRKHLDDAIQLAATSGITREILNPGGDEVLLLDLPATDMTLIDSNVFSSEVAQFAITGISSEWTDWLLVAWLRSTIVANTGNLSVWLNNDSTSGHYYYEKMKTFGGGVPQGSENTQPFLFQDIIPAANAPVGSFGLLIAHLGGVNSASYGVTALGELHFNASVSTLDTVYVSWASWYNQLSVVNRIDIDVGANVAVGSQYKLFGMK